MNPLLLLVLIWLIIAALIACIWWLFNAIADHAEWQAVEDHQDQMAALEPERRRG